MEGAGWRRRAAINGVGAATTGLVTLLVIQAKFTQGAWMVTIAIPLLILAFLAINRHYRVVARRLRAGVAAVRSSGPATNTTVVYVEALDPATRRASWYADLIAGRTYHPIHVRGDRAREAPIRVAAGSTSRTEGRASRRWSRESGANAVLDYVWGLPRGESRFVTVLLPETFARKLARQRPRRRTTFSLKLRLLSEPGVVICDVPVVLDEPDATAEPTHAAGRVLVSGVHAATERALNYATTLGLPDTKAVFFAFDHEEAEALRRDWGRSGYEVPLEIVEAPFRDLGDPLLSYLREITADPDVAVSVIMPELVFNGARKLLHNQRALYIKRLLLFEPRVLLSSVPYHLP